MNFLNAIRHAAIGYGIRRKAWANEDAILTLDNFAELYWMHTTARNDPAKLAGPDRTYDLSVEDLQAKDWETV